MNETENTDKKQLKHWQFKKGQSGNPKGKPKGARHKTTLAIQTLFDGEAEEIGRKVIELAKAGDITAIRLVMERIFPARRDNYVSFDMPKIANSKDISVASAFIMQAVANGELTPLEAKEISSIIEIHRKAIEQCELEERIKKLEEIGGVK